MFLEWVLNIPEKSRTGGGAISGELVGRRYTEEVEDCQFGKVIIFKGSR